jgi:1-acyl-sn-glycerol-3-phosphate acyltransferase
MMHVQSLWTRVRLIAVTLLQRMIGFCLPLLFHRSMRRGLHAVWHKGSWRDLPKGGLILAANHPSWWDMYVCWLIGQKLERPLSGIMRDDSLKTFPFFRAIGVVGQSELREALRRLKTGHILQIFPSGDMQQGAIKNSHQGVAFLAEKSGVAVYPLALRVVVRGAQQPEVFIVLGEAVRSQHDRTEFLNQLESAINQLLDDIDNTVQSTHPEATPEGFEAWLAPRQRFDQRMAKLGKLWQR